MLAALVTAALLLSPSRAPQDTTTLVIAATTDVHGRALSWDYERNAAAPLGLVRVATVVDSLRRRYGDDRVLLVDAGDLLQGNAFAGYFAEHAPASLPHPILAAMTRMGYTVATPGNHDYNFGIDAFARMRRSAGFPYVSANIVRPDGTPEFRQSLVVTRGGVRIGFTGLTTPGVMIWDGAKVRGRLRFLDARAAVPPVLRRLATEADVTVLIAHAGLAGPSSYDTTVAPPENTVAAVLGDAPATVAVIGHTHREIADSLVNGTLVVQAGAHARVLAVATLTLARDDGRWRVVRKEGRIIRLDRVVPSAALVNALAAAHVQATAFAETPLGTSADAMPATRGRLEDTPLIDFINAVQLRVSGAELSAAAAFDPAAAIPAGPVRLRDVAGVYPYDNNRLVAVRISGADLRAYLEHAARYWRGMGPGGPISNDSVPGYNFDIVAGAAYELDLSRPLGQRVTRLTVRGRDVAPGDSFTLALNDYRQQGGGNFPAVARAPVVYRGDAIIRDLLADEIRRRRSIRAADYFVPNWRLTGAPAAASPAASDSIVLRILSTNDVHGRLAPRPETWSGGRAVGGAAALAGMMNRLEAECACPTLRLDGGDMMQGTPISNLTFGRATIAAANAIGYDAAAIGNHEFDWSVDTLAARIRESRFPWLAANIAVTRTRRRPEWAVPWQMIQAGPLRVAVVGYITPGTTTSTNPRNVAHLGFRGAPSVDSMIAAARAQRADVVIVVAHEGAFCNRDECDGAIVRLALDLRNKPDLIVSGHTHSLVTTVVAGVPIIQSRTGATNLGVSDFVVAGGRRTVRMRVDTVWTDREAPDTAVARIVSEFSHAVDSIARRPVTVFAERMHRDSALGPLIAESQRRAAGADIGLINATGIRRSLDAGPATWGDVFEVLPFGNFVMRLELTGAVLRRMLEHALRGPGDVRAHLAGITATVDTTRPAGERIVSAVLADGRVLHDTGHYILGISDFLANGGSGYAMLRGVPSSNTGMIDLDAFIDYLRTLPQPVRPPRANRSGQ